MLILINKKEPGISQIGIHLNKERSVAFTTNSTTKSLLVELLENYQER